MARQASSLTLKGSLGNITFFKSGDTYLVRTKGGIPANKIATHPSFQRTRENNAEFGTAAKGGMLLRKSLRSSILNAKDSRVANRLTSQMVRVLHTDTVNFRGLRNITAGDVGLLENFEFNNGAKLATTLAAQYTVSYTRASGNIQFSIEDFIPMQLLFAPAGTTHFRLVAAAATVSFGEDSYEAATATSGNLVYNNTATGALTLSMALPANSTHPVFIVLGVEFLQKVNGDQYSLYNSAFNACCLVKVDMPA